MSDEIEMMPPELMETGIIPRGRDTRPPLSLEGVNPRVIDIFQDEPIEMLLGLIPMIEETMKEDD